MTAPYTRVQLFSGGGARFGYYLGSYAALCEHNLKPDLIIASCGGSLAALLVDIAPEPKQLQALSISQELFNVVRASQPRVPNHGNRHSLLSKTGYFPQAIKRWLLSKHEHRLNHFHRTDTHDSLLSELQHFAMFDIIDEADWLESLMSLKDSTTNASYKFTALTAPDIAIIASRLLPAHASIAPAFLQEVLFAPTNIVAQSQFSFDCPIHAYAPQRIAPSIHMIEKWDISQAVRVSMADMYYLQPRYIEDLGWCLGGVIDLTPIELASQLGQRIFAETKAPYDKHLATPAIKRIFGFDPNSRLNAVHNFKSNHLQHNAQIHWLPFADNGQALAGQHVQKRMNFRAGLIELIHPEYDGFVQQMQAQWQYGYERTRDFLEHSRLSI
ncbi:patatin-like phospholipase family protein [Psychrobacter urativorans]|uniref:PNPLA domain-containing protein n=1 Tax=Psychrobacter urativorans TaxID=45610 RepID=A0A0M3V987_9GAMM|nr:patatin-like phospholipase family protein [Psychrobacter urativorans]ALF60207.1 hypothetical protein AOC03_09295 [Psychrobacter urativorans]